MQARRIRLTKRRRRLSTQIHQGKTSGIPELISEVPGRLHCRGGVALTVVIQADVLTSSGNFTHQSKAQSIGAITLDEQQRINTIAGAFAHLAILLIPHQAMDIDVCERHATGEGTSHHRHPRHPEKDDVEPCDQSAGGIPTFKVCTLLIRPAHGGEGPKTTGKPGIKNIFILLDDHSLSKLITSLLPCLLLRASHQIRSGIGQLIVSLTDNKPGRNAMAPPQLPADAPITNLSEPIAIDLLPTIGYEAGCSMIQTLMATGR